jgi:5'-nucleotidase
MPADFRYAAKFARKLALLIGKRGLPPSTLLNVNVPPLKAKEIKGVLITRQGKAVWNDTFDQRRDPNNREYYWLTGGLEEVDKDLEFDEAAVRSSYISVTPLHYDLTDYKMFEAMKKWRIHKIK